MKKILSVSSVFLAFFLLFAQDEEENQPQPLNVDVAQQGVENANGALPQDEAQEQAAQPRRAIVHDVFFVGLQTGNAPEIRDRFEDMVRSRWGTESSIRFIPREQTLRILRRTFLDGAVEVDPTLFNELRKHGLENSIALLITVEEYSVKPVRRLGIIGEAEGRLGVRFLFYDVAHERALLVTRTLSVSRIRKTVLGWRPPSARVHITASDRVQINAELLEDAVAKGFDMMKIAVSLKNNAI